MGEESRAVERRGGGSTEEGSGKVGMGGKGKRGGEEAGAEGRGEGKEEGREAPSSGQLRPK